MIGACRLDGDGTDFGVGSWTDPSPLGRKTVQKWKCSSEPGKKGLGVSLGGCVLYSGHRRQFVSRSFVGHQEPSQVAGNFAGRSQRWPGPGKGCRGQSCGRRWYLLSRSFLLTPNPVKMDVPSFESVLEFPLPDLKFAFFAQHRRGGPARQACDLELCRRHPLPHPHGKNVVDLVVSFHHRFYRHVRRG